MNIRDRITRPELSDIQLAEIYFDIIMELQNEGKPISLIAHSMEAAGADKKLLNQTIAGIIHANQVIIDEQREAEGYKKQQ